MNYTQHPLSCAFPAMSNAEFQALKDSIETNGVLNPATLFEGEVIDGWHRYSAATQLGMDCPVSEMDSSIDPRDFVKAQNESRRHLTASQRAAAIVSIYEWHPAHREKKGTPSTHLSKTNAELAAIAKVSPSTIKQAKVAQKAGLTDAVKDGAMTVKEAAKIASGKPLKDMPQAADPEPEDHGPSPEEIAANHASELADRALMATLLESDAPLALLVEENKQLRAEISQLKQARDGYMNRCNEAIALVKSRDRQIAKMEKSMRDSA